MRHLALLLATATSACAASGPATRSAPPERIVVQSETVGTIVDADIVRSEHIGVHAFPVAAERLWNLLPDAYIAVGLPLPELDPQNRIAAVQNHSVSRRLKDTQLSRYLDCGQDLTGRLADRNRVRLTVRTWLERQDANSTVVRTQIAATATSTDRAGSAACTSTGVLEEQIARALALKLAA